MQMDIQVQDHTETVCNTAGMHSRTHGIQTPPQRGQLLLTSSQLTGTGKHRPSVWGSSNFQKDSQVKNKSIVETKRVFLLNN